jgi:heme exporter protein D
MEAVMKDTEKQTAPVTQQPPGFRQNWPIWLRQMPVLSFPLANDKFQLIDQKKFNEFLDTLEPEIAEGLRTDLVYLDHELLRMFIKRDHEAAFHQNRYRLFQIYYIVLAALATLFGSMMGLAINSNPGLVAWLAFGETLIALLTTYVATLGSRQPPLQRWIESRRRAEFLRREYFRYLVNLPPYDQVRGYTREMLLSRRAADINRGGNPSNTSEAK